MQWFTAISCTIKSLGSKQFLKALFISLILRLPTVKKHSLACVLICLLILEKCERTRLRNFLHKGAPHHFMFSAEGSRSLSSRVPSAVRGHMGNLLNDIFTLLCFTECLVGLNSIPKGCQESRGAAASKSEPVCQRLLH